MTTKAVSDGMMTIGAAAEAVGVATSVLRYYEDQGLAVPSARGDNGYRMYASKDVDRLRFIRSAQGVGFSLDDIRTLLNLEQSGAECCQAEVQQLLERRLAQVDEKMKELKRVRTALGRALYRCRRSNGQCAVVNEFGPKMS